MSRSEEARRVVARADGHFDFDEGLGKAGDEGHNKVAALLGRMHAAESTRWDTRRQEARARRNAIR
jgi:hypothetical protein